jgi:hypothetical protein
MAGAGIRSFAKFRSQMQRNATTAKPLSSERSQIHTSVCGNPRDGYSILDNPGSKRRGLPQSAAHI